MIEWAVWILLGALVVLALLSPLESLRWWAKDGDEAAGMLQFLTPPPDGVPSPSQAPRQFVVYLSGVGAVGGKGNSNSKTEQHFLRALEEQVPGTRVIGDVFPYSAANRGLTERRGGRLWARAGRGRESTFPSLAPYVVNLRNVFQVLVAIDPRYGPTYGLGLANVISRAIRAEGYVPGSGATVTVIGYSGGSQMALNASWFLESGGIPTQIISMGGVFTNAPAFTRIHRFLHLWGSKDLLHRLGAVISPGRWRWVKNSAFHDAQAEGRAVNLCIGPMKHDSKRWYLDHRAIAPDGRSYFDTTVEVIVEFLQETPPPTAPTEPPPPTPTRES